jgi:O-antigen/teichoic acid export membrane protein
LAVSFIFPGLTAQHYAILVRQMRFDAMAALQLISLLISVLVGIVLAFAGWSYWALVCMTITQGATSAIIAWVASPWRPSWLNRTCNVRELVVFGGQLTAYDALTYLTRNADNFLIGRFLGAETLGIYSKAYGLLMVPIQQINAPLNGVILPALSRLQDQPEQFRNYYNKAISSLSFITVPIIAFAFADADQIVLVLLGPQWVGAADIFRWLAPAALVGTINLAPTWLLTARGKTDQQLKWAYLTTPILIAGFAVGLIWGPIGVAASFSLTYAVCFVFFMMSSCRNSPVRFADVVAAVLPATGASLVATGAVFVAQYLMKLQVHWAALVINALIFSIVYVLACTLSLSGREQLRSIVRLLRRKTD